MRLQQDFRGTHVGRVLQLSRAGWRVDFPPWRSPPAASAAKGHLPVANLDLLSMMPDETWKLPAQLSDPDETIGWFNR